MSDINKGELDRHRDEGVFVSRIEGEKKEKEPFIHLPKDKSNRILFATFCQYLDRLFESFVKEETLASKFIEKQNILDTLITFKELLTKLSEKDLSKDSAFAQALSAVWLKLQDDMESLAVLERKNTPALVTLRTFVDAIKTFPPGTDHHLGYYLTEHAGKDWLPFPFIDMLFQLHQEKKTAQTWIELIEEAKKNLRRIPHFKPG